jgi:hypothetical protein
VLRRCGLILMLLLTGWIPFQSVAAWQSMTRAEFPQTTLAVAAPMQMVESCHAGMHATMVSPVVTKSDTNSAHDMQQHGSQCASCLPLCTGVPPAIAPVRELAAQTQLHFPAVDSLYRDFIPGVLSPPPLALII